VMLSCAMIAVRLSGRQTGRGYPTLVHQRRT
jgi:hypothetical protein